MGNSGFSSHDFHDEDRLIEALAGRARGSIVCLFGAGLSVPHVPPVDGIVHLVREYVSRNGTSPARLDEELTKSGNRYQSALGYLNRVYGPNAVANIIRDAVLNAREEAMDSPKLKPARAGNVKECEHLEDDIHGWKLTSGLIALGQLVAQHSACFGHFILTTNFDPLIETSIRVAGGDCCQVVLYEDGRLDRRDRSRCNVVHLHGTWFRSDTLHTPTQLSQPRQKLGASLREVLEGRTLVVFAYGGWRDVITSTLVDMAAACDGNPDIIWTFFNDDSTEILRSHETLLSHLRPLANRGRLFLYKGIDCNRTLPQLLNLLSANALNSKHDQSCTKESQRDATEHSAFSTHTMEQAEPLYPNFVRILHLLGFQDPLSCQVRGSGWALWSAEALAPGAHRAQTVGVLLIATRPTKDRLDEMVQAIWKPLQASDRVMVVLTEDAEHQRYADAVRDALGRVARVDIWECNDLVYNVHARIRNGKRTIQGTPRYFTDPCVQDPDGQTIESGLVTVRDFLVRQRKGALVAIVGPGGLGKTTLARELAGCMLRYNTGPGKGRTPLLVAGEHWISLQKRGAPITIESMLREALTTAGYFSNDPGQVDILSAAGGMCLIFDSFDEVCSRGTSTSPTNVLRRIIRSLVDLPKSRSLIVVTSRDSTWDLVDAEVRRICRVFKLVGFEEKQRSRYLSQRFGDDSRAAQEADDLLRNLPDLRTSPLALSMICDAIEAKRSPRPSGEATQECEDTAKYSIAELMASTDRIREDAIVGLAHQVCRREQKYHRLPLDGPSQIRLLTSVVVECGPSFTLSDFLVLATSAPHHLNDEQARQVLEHHVLLVRYGNDSFGFRYREVEHALIVVQVLMYLRTITRDPFPHLKDLGLVLSQIVRQYPDAIARVVAGLAAHQSNGSLADIWKMHSKNLSSLARGGLFQVLIAVISAKEFLPLVDGRYTASGFQYTGPLRNVSLCGVSLREVEFVNAEIDACEFDSMTEFRNCTFVNCRIAKSCRGIHPALFRDVRADDGTARRSEEAVRFPGVEPDSILDSAFDAVLWRLILLERQRETASVFSHHGPIADDPVERAVLQVLRRCNVVSGDGDNIQLCRVCVEAAEEYVTTGKIRGALQKAVVELRMRPASRAACSASART